MNISTDYKSVFLEGTVLNSNNYISPSSIIAIKDSTLYARSIRKDTLMEVYKMKGDSLIVQKPFLSGGNGPYEMQIAVPVYEKETNSLYLFEGNGKLQFAYIIDMDKPENIYNSSSWEKINFNWLENIRFGLRIIPISPDSFLTVCGTYSKPEILSIIDVKNKTCIPLPFWPKDGYEKNNLIKQSVYMDNAMLGINKLRNKLVYAGGWGKYLEIFDIKNAMLTERKNIWNIFPKYKGMKDNMNYGIDHNDKYGGLKVYVTDNFIYVKPIEYKVGKDADKHYKGYPHYYNDKINVFDWDGILIKSYILDTPVCTFIVDNNDELLYADTDELETGEMIIKKYALK